MKINLYKKSTYDQKEHVAAEIDKLINMAHNDGLKIGVRNLETVESWLSSKVKRSDVLQWVKNLNGKMKIIINE